MVIVFDLDDTVCETDSYSEKYIKKYIKDNRLPYKQIASVVRYAEQKFDWSQEDSVKWYKSYGDDMMLKFPCKKNAVKTINKLHDAGHKIIFATARSTDYHNDPKGATLKWLEKNKIKYDNIYFGIAEKEKVCELENADVFIDDDINITKRVFDYYTITNKKQVKVFLMNSSYNKQLSTNEGIKRLRNFSELFNILN